MLFNFEKNINYILLKKLSISEYETKTLLH